MAVFKLQIWREYDTDGSGFIEADELKNFLRDLLREAKKINDVSEDKLIEYTDTMVRNQSFIQIKIYFYCLKNSNFFFQLQVFDSNKDGRLQLSEMAK